jgi:hypothetical protein
MGRAVATLVFRQALKEWQIHGLGDYLRTSCPPGSAERHSRQERRGEGLGGTGRTF